MIDQERLQGAIITVSIVIILWLVLAMFLLKSEPKAVKKNMADRYDELSLDELKNFGINSNELKILFYQLFKDIHMSLTNYDYDMLKENLTNDLYKYYTEQLEDLKKRKHKNIMKDFELVNLKIYDIKDICGVLNVSVYMNVRMFDYIMDTDSGKCIQGNDNEKMDFEFEITFLKNKSLSGDCVMSKKTCINKMSIGKNNKK